jgi:hypothetical protein
MDRIDSKYSVPALPAPEAPEKDPGYFSPGDPESETAGTVMPAWWCNQVQEELCTIVTAAGLTLNRTDLGQVLQGILALIAGSPDVAAALSAAALAEGLSRQALSDSGDAKADASQALGQSDAALAASASAGQTAAEAKTTAESAAETATEALFDDLYIITAVGSEIVDETGTVTATAQFDANSYYDRKYNFYLVVPSDPSLPQTPLNLPAELTLPIYFLAEVNSDQTSVSQTAWDHTGNYVYTRIGTTDYSNPDDPVTTWNPWNTIAIPNALKSIDVEIDPVGQPAGTYLIMTWDTENGDVTTYINLTEIIGAGYTSGNGGITITPDNEILLKLDTSEPQLKVTVNGLKFAASLDGATEGQVLTLVKQNDDSLLPEYADSKAPAILTQAQYDALGPEKNTNNIIYLIVGGGGG